MYISILAIIFISKFCAIFILFRLYKIRVSENLLRIKNLILTKLTSAYSLAVATIRRRIGTGTAVVGDSMDENETTCKLFKFMQVEVNNACEVRPSRRSGHRGVCTKSDFYIWGGYCPTQGSGSPLFPELWQFNFATATWYLLETTGDIPSTYVASPSALLHGNRMIVYGGTGFPFGAQAGDGVYMCNLKTLEWKRLQVTGDPLPGLYGSSIVLWENYLCILFGTTSHQYSSDVYRINLNTLECVRVFDSAKLLFESNYTQLMQLEAQYPNEFLHGRYRQEVVLHDNKIFTFGGSMRNGEAFDLELLPVFDLIKNEWDFVQTHPDETFNAYPEKRKFHSCLKVDTDVYVVGGVYYNIGDDDLTQVKNCVWKFDLNTLRWKKLKIKMPKLTFFHASAISPDGEAYFHGGIATIQNKAQRINKLYRINLKVLKLKEICWERLLSLYGDNLTESNKLDLYKYGIPMEFINRIN